MSGIVTLPFVRRQTIPSEVLREIQSLGGQPRLLAKLGMEHRLLYMVGSQAYDLTLQAHRHWLFRKTWFENTQGRERVFGIRCGYTAYIHANWAPAPWPVWRPTKRWAQKVALNRALKSLGIPV